MSLPVAHDFGLVGADSDHFELQWDAGRKGYCRLESIVQTERGPRRTLMAEIPVKVWFAVRERVVRELVQGMGEDERHKRKPTVKRGINRISLLIGRELAVLFWALMEAQASDDSETILHGWRELAREERWWLFSKAAAPGQHQGAGWRRALFHALAETTATRVAPTETAEKKSPENMPLPAAKLRPGKQPSKKRPAGKPAAGNLKNRK